MARSPGPVAAPAPTDDDGATPPTILLTAAGIDGVTADAFTLVSSVHVGRTSFDYTYSVRITNVSGVALQGATATVASAAVTTVVTDDSLTFGDPRLPPQFQWNGCAATSPARPSPPLGWH